MSDWGGTHDQFTVDTESRYPLFSDIQVTDKSMNSYGMPVRRPDPRRELRVAKTYEDQYLNSSLGIPSQYPCVCGTCPFPENWPRRPETRPARHDNDRLSYGLAGGYGPGYNRLGMPDLPPRGSGIPQMQQAACLTLPGIIQLDGMTLVLIFMFLVLIFIVIMGSKAITDLKAQIKKLKGTTT